MQYDCNDHPDNILCGDCDPDHRGRTLPKSLGSKPFAPLDDRPGQVGGSHYRDLAPHEPFDVIDVWQETWPINIRYYIGNSLKYLARLGRKSGGMRDKDKEDLDKAIHYLQEARRRM